MARQSALPASLAPRLVPREAAAAYLSLSPNKFDQMVADGRMPKPRKMDRRRAWDIRELDAAVDDLPTDGEEQADATWEDVDAT